ncbi:MAG: hypothetical protein ACRDGV_07000, partial [Candidatus Limnocylindria bacterium]
AAVSALLVAGGPPATATLLTAGASSTHADLGLPIVRVADRAQLVRAVGITARPLAGMPSTSDPAWVSLGGRLVRGDADLVLETADGRVRLQEACRRRSRARDGEIVSVEGLAAGGQDRVVAGCGAIRPGPTLVVARGTAGAKALSPATGQEAALRRHDVSGAPRLIAAALLLGGMLLLLGAGAHAWRVSRRSAAGIDHELDDEDATPSAEDVPSPPQLTLVRLPRERGSP